MSKKRIKIVIFDFDGVLNNSLLAHLEFLRDMKKRYSNQYALDFEIPNTEKEGRKIVACPMRNFVKKAGFHNKELVDLIVNNYESFFFEKYPTSIFSGVKEMLCALKKKEIALSVASSNVFENIKKSLYDYLGYVDYVLTLDNSFESKKEKIQKILEEKAVNPKKGIFVGDMRSDYEAAKKARISFVGVKYGWGGFLKGNEKFPVAENIQELTNILLSF